MCAFKLDYPNAFYAARLNKLIGRNNANVVTTLYEE